MDGGGAVLWDGGGGGGGVKWGGLRWMGWREWGSRVCRAVNVGGCSGGVMEEGGCGVWGDGRGGLCCMG